MFVSDLHGRQDRFLSLAREAAEEPPEMLFIGGDIFPGVLMHSRAARGSAPDFVSGFLFPLFTDLRRVLGVRYPRVFVISGNDDPRSLECALQEGEAQGLWEYAHMKRIDAGGWTVAGYSYVPPTPFRLKDWERYDVSRFVDPGCIHPEEGHFTVPPDSSTVRYRTIEEDLAELTEGVDVQKLVLLSHAPPWRTLLDRAALDGRTVDHVPLDVNVGSVALRRFIERKQPWVTLHGHVHESARLTGAWRDTIGATRMFSAAHDGPELAVVRFDLERPGNSRRSLVRQT